MTIRYCAFLALLLICSSTSAQKYPLFHAVDSVKKVQKDTLSSLLRSNAPNNTVVSITEKFDNILDALKDSARDYADSVMEHMEKCSHFELGVNVESRQLIYGRKGPAYDAEGVPALKYMHKTGIYLMFNTDEYKLDYQQARTVKKPPKTDTVTVDKIESDIVLTAGFARTFYKWWDVDAYLNHSFIFYGQDRNYLATTFNANTSFNFWDYITLDVYYSLYFGGSSKTPATEKKYSNVLTFGLNHDIKIYRFLGAKVFTITPEFITDVGNDNYVRNRLLARNENGGLTGMKTATDNFFGLLNLEGSINFNYRIKNLEIYVDPRVAIPFNVVPLTAANAAPYRNNTTNGPIFYCTAGIKYLFKFWKERP